MQTGTETVKRSPARAKTRSHLAADMVAAGTHSMASAARAYGIRTESVRIACLKRGIRGITAVGRAAMCNPEKMARMLALSIPAFKAASELRRAERGIPSDAEIIAMTERGMSYEMIARKLKTTRGAIAGIVHRAKRRAAEDGS